MEHNQTILIAGKLLGKKIAEGFIHDIYLDGNIVYKLAKPGFPDYLSFEAVTHELSNMRYLKDHSFPVASGYEIFRCEAGYGLRMSFISGKPLSNEALLDALFQAATSITENWAGSPDNQFESWNRYLQFNVTRQLTQIKQISAEDCDYLCKAISCVKIQANCLLLIDANMRNVIVGADGTLFLLDMDRLILGDPRFQRIYLQYQRGTISLLEYPETWLGLLYAVLIIVEDISFRVNHGLAYAEQLKLYMHLMNRFKQCP